MDRLVLSFLGEFHARLESGPNVVIPPRKAQALLAYLACSPIETHSRDKLAALLWGDSEQRCARHSLRQALCMLRAALPEAAAAAIRAGTEDISVDRGRLLVDVLEFERLAQEGTPQALERAGVLYRGDFLAHIGAGDQAFEDWLRDERDRLNELAFDVYGKLLAHQWKAGLIAKAVLSARTLLIIDPLEEEAYRVLMRLHMIQGRREAALQAYEKCAEMLRQEFGAEPQAETKTLLTEITSRGFVRKPRVHLMVDEADSVHGRRKPGGRISRSRRSVSGSGAAPNSRRSMRTHS
jgi:DNA-binding SARP family transcriptional activator